MLELAGFKCSDVVRFLYRQARRQVYRSPKCNVEWSYLFLWRGIAVLVAVGLQSSYVRAAEWIGLVHAQADVQLSVPVAGLVRRVYASPGQSVVAGDVLLELESDLQALELRRRKIILADESELSAAVERLAGVSQLLRMAEDVAVNSMSLSKEEMLKLQLERVSAEARLNQLRAQKARERIEADQAQADFELRRLRSPGSGIVVEVSVDAGEWAKPGDAVIRLVDVASVEVRVNLPQPIASGLRIGMRVLARFEAGLQGAQATGVVRFISPTADGASGLIEVRALFPNLRGSLRPGSKAIIRNFS